jgi:hypothetical protein
MHRSTLPHSDESFLEHEVLRSQPLGHWETQPLERGDPSDTLLVSGSGPRSDPFHRRMPSTNFEMRADKSLANNAKSSKSKHLFTRAIAVSSDRSNRLPSTNWRFREPQLTKSQRLQTSATEQLIEVQGRNKKRRLSSGVPSTVPSKRTTGLTVATQWRSRGAQESAPMEEHEEEDDSASSSGLDESASEQSSDELSEVSELTAEPSADNSSSHGELMPSESGSDVESHRSNSEAEDADEAERPNLPNTSASRIVYLRLPSALSSEKKAELQELLASSYPAAMLILDVKPKRAPLQQRAGLKRLFQFVLSGHVEEVLIASSAQLCNTKEGFEFMEWTCQLLGARVRIVPSLDVF